jgi:hypothetical protein
MFRHGCRIGKDHQKRLKLGRLVLPRALYKAHLRVLKLDSLFLFHGAPKMSLPIIFRSSILLWRMGQMHQKVAQFVGYGRVFDMFFGSSQTDDWLLRYGPSRFWGMWCLKTKDVLCINLVYSRPNHTPTPKACLHEKACFNQHQKGTKSIFNQK